MDSTNAVTSVGTLPATGALGLVARWRRLRASARAGRRQRLIGFGVGRFLALLAALLVLTLWASVESVSRQADEAAQLHAQAALDHVHLRLETIDQQMAVLAAQARIAGPEDCPDALRRALMRASIDSLLVTRFAVIESGVDGACFPDGPGPAPKVPLAIDAERHLSASVNPERRDAGDDDDDDRATALWVTRPLHAGLPGVHLAAELDPRALIDWTAATTPGVGALTLPSRSWTARLSAPDGRPLALIGALRGATPIEPTPGQRLWSTRYGVGVTALLEVAALRAAVWRRAGVAMAVVALVTGLLGLALWRRTVLRARLSHRIHRGLRKRQFEPHVQPIIDLQTGRCAGVEVLMRWHHPQRGVLAPAEFIEEAERTGLIVGMSDLVMSRAAHRLAAIAMARPDLYFSFNVTPLQLRQPDFLRRLATLFRADTLPRERVLLELTEREFVDADTGRILAALRADGWRVAIDDFGTGHSSLAALEQIAIDRIKIDRAFVRTIDEGTVNRPVLDAIIALAGQLGVPLIAEGVETRSQWDYLAARGVRHAQGYLMARPMPIEAFAAWLAERGETPARSPAGAGAAEHAPASDPQVQALWHQMRMPGGLDVRDRVHRLQTYRQCFVGREAVDWIVQRLGVRRSEAVRIGQRLAALDRIRHVRDEHDFDDADLFFCFVQSGAEPVDVAPASDELRRALRGPHGPRLGMHARGLICYRDATTGRAIVDWIVQRYGVSRLTACQWAAHQMRVGALRHVFDDRPFRDDRTLYQAP